MSKPHSELVKATRDRYRKAGLVQINAWIPPDERDRLVRECRQLREIYLAKLTLQQAGETGPTTEDHPPTHLHPPRRSPPRA